MLNLPDVCGSTRPQSEPPLLAHDSRTLKKNKYLPSSGAVNTQTAACRLAPKRGNKSIKPDLLETRASQYNMQLILNSMGPHLKHQYERWYCT
jgi:hypothetical protein